MLLLILFVMSSMGLLHSTMVLVDSIEALYVETDGIDVAFAAIAWFLWLAGFILTARGTLV